MSITLLLTASSVYAFGGGGPAPATIVAINEPTGIAGVNNVTLTNLSEASRNCIRTAIQTRDAAIANAFALYMDTANQSYVTRAADLSTAFDLTKSQETIVNTVHTVWETFASSTKSAHAAWLTARASAWKTYDSTVLSCKNI
jgi:hypothetical protein